MKRPNLKDTASVWLEYVLALEAKVERLERAGRHLADCDFAGTEVEFRCERCVESRAVLEGREP